MFSQARRLDHNILIVEYILSGYTGSIAQSQDYMPKCITPQPALILSLKTVKQYIYIYRFTI
jgi:hypothetical protein